jgi:hypothetical protein
MASEEKQATPKVGDVLNGPVHRDHRFVTLPCDNVLVSFTEGSIEISVLQLETVYMHQQMTIKTMDESGGLELEGGQFRANTLPFHLGTVRMRPDVALNAASALLEHLLTYDVVPREQVVERLAASGIEIK